MAKAIWDVTGHGGLKCCTLQCRNMVHFRREDDEEGVALADMQEGDELVDISCCDLNQFDNIVDLVARGCSGDLVSYNLGDHPNLVGLLSVSAAAPFASSFCLKRLHRPSSAPAASQRSTTVRTAVRTTA